MTDCQWLAAVKVEVAVPAHSPTASRVGAQRPAWGAVAFPASGSSRFPTRYLALTRPSPGSAVLALATMFREGSRGVNSGT